MNEFFTTNLGVAVILLGQTLAVVGFVMISLLFLVYGDRKIWAAVQMRRGPNVVGLFGLLQTVADALKYVVKEIVIPAGADRPVFILAPLVSFVLAMLAWAVIPFNHTWVLADINAALLFVFAVSSLEVYGVIMGGWASNSKYPFLGSLRSAAQMVSYEVSIGFVIVAIAKMVRRFKGRREVDRNLSEWAEALGLVRVGDELVGQIDGVPVGARLAFDLSLIHI